MSKYLSIITLKVNGLNAPIKRHRIDEWIRSRPTHMLPIRDPSQNKRPTQAEGEGLEKNIPSKWTGKRSWGSNTYTRQNRLYKQKPQKGTKKVTT